MSTCPFCDIIDGQAPAEFIARWDNAVAFRPLNPVVPGHTLVVPKVHVRDARTDSIVTGETFECAASLARQMVGADVNLITSAGPAAAQTVAHLHVHVVPRYPEDGLLLPWSIGDLT